MSYKNSAIRLFLPLLRKNLRQKRPPLWINKRPICSSTQSVTRILNFNSTNKYFFHTTTIVNKTVPFNLSDIGEGIKEVVVREWYVKEGDSVKQFEKICEVQSDKASVTITSRYDGVVKKIHHKVDDIVQVGQALVDIEVGDDVKADEPVKKEAPVAAKPPEQVAPSTKPVQEVKSQKVYSSDSDSDTESSKKGKDIFAIPSVRRLARQNKINLAEVTGTGKHGRILKEDILKYLQQGQVPKATKKSATPPDSTYSKPIRGYAMAMVKTMTEAMKIPHFVYKDEISVTNLIELRAKAKPLFEDRGVKLTYMPFFIKASSNALSAFPVLNTRLDDKIQNIIYINNHNIGIAMDTPLGLVVPVIKDVQDKNILEIAEELNRLQGLAKQAKFAKEDLEGGTFSISNIGSIGGTYASPIILPPQRAIIALGAFKKLPRFNSEGNVVPENIAYISAAADHRIVDGATMANFCNCLKKQIEEPLLLFMN